MRELTVPVTTHGRLLIEDARLRSSSFVEGSPGDASPLRILAGCHGYAQNADEMMELLRGIPADASWTRVSIQALHRFYRSRSQTTVASWMTRQDRDLLIGDNVTYVDEAVAVTAGARPIERLVFCGFSQGVAMAFRAGLLGARKADAILALGGDVPPELLADAGLAFPRVLLARGTRDEWYTVAKLQADEAALRTRGAQVDTLTFDGGHEWHVEFGARAASLLAVTSSGGPSQ